jgi:TonB family protein
MNEKQKNIALVGSFGLSVVLVGVLFLRTPKSQPVHPSLIPVNVSSEKQKPEYKSPYEQNQVKNTIVKNNPLIQECYLAHLKKEKALTSGKVQVDWQISPQGETLMPQIVTSTLDDSDMDQCVLEKVKTFQFPPPPSDKPVYTTFTYVFRKQGESVAPQMVPLNKK